MATLKVKRPMRQWRKTVVMLETIGEAARERQHERMVMIRRPYGCRRAKSAQRADGTSVVVWKKGF